MKRTLYLKLLLGYVAFGILAFLTIATFTSRQTLNYVEKDAISSMYRESNLLASSYASNFYRGSMTLEDITSQFHSVATYLDAEIWLIGGKGNILITTNSDSVPDGLVKNFNISSFGTKYYQKGTFFDTFSEKTITVFSPVTINYKVRGYLMIHKPVSDLVRFKDGFLNISYLTLAIIFLCAFVMLGLFTFTVYIPIRKITQAAKEYSEGNFDTKINIHSNDEIGYLAGSINYMAAELSTLEEDQRKFIANVSHDFRSPLTSIKGYIEAIMDGTIPHEMQDKYLNIILFETERLNKLTQGMLELNKYGSKGSMLDISSFDINNTIKLVVQSFEGTCKKKKISFELILTGQTSFVSADMSKIQQVLYNLIDNAIKFSHPDSSITIETTEKNDKVFISVKDTGIGIPKDSIKKIWERFYKTDLSRGKDKRGTGLGLAIVREIISVHNENINVISTEGVGTEFIFTLPLTRQESPL
ncbi:MAG: HAMP domain-containing histidine kinase [Lachnospiraceae bacterium]|nr:HAMP domain-containing histidine kinase [Lachnospiraceae bacterium]